MQSLPCTGIYKDFSREIKSGNIRLAYDIQTTQVCAKVTHVDTEKYSVKCCNISNTCDVECAMKCSKLWAFYSMYNIRDIDMFI